jgi:hypothetical protein
MAALMHLTLTRCVLRGEPNLDTRKGIERPPLPVSRRRQRPETQDYGRCRMRAATGSD